MHALSAAPNLKQLTAETAAALVSAVAAGQPVTTKLVTTCIAEALRDEQTLAGLLRLSVAGENAFANLVHAVIGEEAEQIALSAVTARGHA